MGRGEKDNATIIVGPDLAEGIFSQYQGYSQSPSFNVGIKASPLFLGGNYTR